ncbi:tRNA pseudouridine(38-40) synthase TruA [Priestia koreensis]|uniref:tRNA pseudouridine(38-40) synthase TruA n=1 Tax=Priestia koreensis TaxID=284581 RepID=UPI003D0676EE
MNRIKCTISYDGTLFAGFQSQPDQRTVQGEVEKALKRIHKGSEIKIQASGRTDATVHAYGQVIHFDSPLAIPNRNWIQALNSSLPMDVVVKEVETVSEGFHARYDVTSKEYRYRVLRSKERDVFSRAYAFHYPYPLNYEEMRESLQYLIGTHDFTSFCSMKTDKENKVRTIYEIDFFEENDELIFRFVGSGFLYNMVRILVGTLLEVGRGKINSLDVKKILEQKKRENVGKTAPGHGLYLWRVTYDN